MAVSKLTKRSVDILRQTVARSLSMTLISLALGSG